MLPAASFQRPNSKVMSLSGVLCPCHCLNRYPLVSLWFSQKIKDTGWCRSKKLQANTKANGRRQTCIKPLDNSNSGEGNERAKLIASNASHIQSNFFYNIYLIILYFKFLFLQEVYHSGILFLKIRKDIGKIFCATISIILKNMEVE